MVDNDFSVEHTRVSVRQMAGTLERVVKYERWPPKRLGTFWRPATTRTTFFFFFFFRRIIFPGKGAKYGLFWGDCLFLQPLAHAG